MTDKQQPKTYTSQKDQDKKLPQLQPLNLEQLDGIWGGAFGVAGLPGTGLFGHMVIPQA